MAGMENWDDENEDYNIGADEGDQLPYNRHEAAAFDYTHIGSNPNADSSEKVNDSQKANYQNGFADFHSLVNGQGEGESFPKCFVSVGQLKAKQKLQKKKEKRAAGWTKSNDIEGHVDILEMNKLLDFVGVAEDTQSALTAQQQKKKLRKKLAAACRQKNDSDQHSTVNGRCSPSASRSTSSDSEVENKGASNHNTAVSKNQMSYSMTDTTTSNPTSNLRTTNSSVATGTMNSQINYGNFSDRDRNEFDIHTHSDGEFKEVHRKKKNSNKFNSSKPATGAYHNRPIDQRIPAKSQRPNGTVRYTEGAMSTKQKTAVVSVLTETRVDLSLSSFPVLESQNNVDRRSPSGDTASATASATDDDKDSVASQPMTNSWAKIAAKPTTAKAPVIGVKNHTTGQPQPYEVSAVKDSVAKQAIASVGDCSNNHNEGDIEDASMLGSYDMTSSVSIEFGTVTSSTDEKDDQHVQRILSNSYCEGQNLFKIGNQSRNSKPVRDPSVNSPSRNAIKNSKSKGVVFLDKYSEEKYHQHPHIPISFGFDDNESLAQNDSGGSTPISNPSSLSSGYNDIAASTISSSPPLGKELGATSNNSNNPSLPQPVDILQQLLAASSLSPQSDSKQHSSSEDCGKFNLVSTVNMLQKEFDEVIKLRNEHGRKRVVYSHEL